ncbi:MAG: hypothetical protein M1834_005665 [Cirrosporium novae-zelandiae]|nr:MAG: hypothetical protein M1834_005665 [Cirrosporium novae-zelandiae]
MDWFTSAINPLSGSYSDNLFFSGFPPSPTQPLQDPFSGFDVSQIKGGQENLELNFSSPLTPLDLFPGICHESQLETPVNKSAPSPIFQCTGNPDAPIYGSEGIPKRVPNLPYVTCPPPNQRSQQQCPSESQHHQPTVSLPSNNLLQAPPCTLSTLTTNTPRKRPRSMTPPVSRASRFRQRHSSSNPSRAGSTYVPTPEEQLLLTLKDDANLQWKEIAERFRETMGRSCAVPALQMRFKRLRERTRVWTADEEVALRKAEEYWRAKRWDIVAAKMLDYGTTERWPAKMCERRWEEIEPSVYIESAGQLRHPSPQTEENEENK